MPARERSPAHPRLRSRWSHEATYEAAWVLPLGAGAAAQVEALRAQLSLPAPPEGVLVPHLTVLYLGQGSGAWITRLCEALSEMPAPIIDLDLARWGTFGDGATVRNLHLRPLEASSLHPIHAEARERCAQLGWVDPSAWSGPRFVPHVSLFDGLALRGDALPPLPRARVVDRLVRFAALGRRVGGSS